MGLSPRLSPRAAPPPPPPLAPSGGWPVPCYPPLRERWCPDFPPRCLADRGGRLDHPQALFYHSNELCQPLNRRHMLTSFGACRRRSYPARRELSERKSSLVFLR